MLVNRNKVLKFLHIKAEDWAERYGIEMFSAPCGGCQKELTPSIPFAIGELRGLMCQNKIREKVSSLP